MHITQLTCKKNFIDDLVKYLICNFESKLHKVKIIMPSGIICQNLQNQLIINNKSTLLPNIITFANLHSSGDGAFSLPHNQYEIISPIDEKIILSNIIAKYKSLNISTKNSINLTEGLSNLFFELEINDIDISNLHQFPGFAEIIFDQANYLLLTCEFIKYAYQAFLQELTNLRKITRGQYQKNMLRLESQRLKKNKDEILILVGTRSINKTINNFFQNIYKLDNVYYIIPPMPLDIIQDNYINLIGSNNNKKINTEEFYHFPLYSFHELFNLIKLDLMKIDPMKIDIRNNENQYFNKLLDYNTNIDHNINTTTNHSRKRKQIIYAECDNIFDEAKFIAQESIKYLKTNKQTQNDFKIAIITSNMQTKLEYEKQLKYHNLQYLDLIGDNLISNKIINLFFILSNILSEEKFNIKNFINLIFHNINLSKESKLIYNFLIRSNKKFDSINDVITQINQKESEDTKYILSYFEKYINFIYDVQSKIQSSKDNISITDFSMDVIILIKYMYHIHNKSNEQQLEEEINSQYIEQFFESITNKRLNILSQDITQYPDILYNITKNVRILNNDQINSSNDIIICKSDDIALITVDLIIITNMNESAYPQIPAISNNNWLNSKLQNALSIYPEKLIGYSLYNFYLNLQNENIIITRAKKTLDNSNNFPSSFIARLNYHYHNNLKKLSQNEISQIINDKSYNNHSYKQQTKQDQEYIISNNFPNKISVSDMELLIRAPYNFYAKKILGLYKLDNILQDKFLIEFGNIFHHITDIYNKRINIEQSKDNNISNDYDALLKIYLTILDNSLNNSSNNIKLEQYQKEIIRYKLEIIAKEFILFDQKARINNHKIYSEVSGEILLNIPDDANQAIKQIKIICIADRLEIDQNNNLFIYDYKTGNLPLKSDVMALLSPQLILEAIIALAKGEDHANEGFVQNTNKIKINNVTKLIYIKIASSAPYLKFMEIVVDNQQIMEYKKQIIDILKNYITNKKFNIKEINSKYDDYLELSRR